MGSAFSTLPLLHKKDISDQHHQAFNNSELCGSWWRRGHWMHFTTLPAIHTYYAFFCSPASYSMPSIRVFEEQIPLHGALARIPDTPSTSPITFPSQLWNSWIIAFKLYSYAWESSALAVHSVRLHSHHLPTAPKRQRWECCRGSC